MLKQLAIVLFLLPLLFSGGEAYPQPAPKTDKGQQPPSLTAPTTPKQADRPAFRSNADAPHDEYGPKSVRVIFPPKDKYDWIAYAASLILVAVGIGGIGVAVCSLRAIGRQADLMEQQAVVMTAQASHMEKQTALLADSVAVAQKSANVAQATLDAIISEKRARIRIEVDGLYTRYEMASVHYWVHLYGSTPAYISGTSAMAIVSESPNSPDALSFFSVDIPPVLTEAKTECKVHISNRSEFSEGDYALLDSGKLFVHFYGMVRYKDAYEKERETAFCHVHKATGLKNLSDGSAFRTWVQNGGPERNRET